MTENDWYAGFKNRKWMYVGLFILCGFLTSFIVLRFSGWIRNGRVEEHFSVTDILVYWFKGSLPIKKRDFSDFDLSEYYMFVVIGIASIIGNYVVRDLNEYGIQVITRVGKKRWLISKIIWNMITVISILGMILITSYVMCFFHPNGSAEFHWSMKYAQLSGYDLNILNENKTVNWGLLALMPIVSMLALGMYQFTLSLICSPVISYIVMVFQMVLCMFHTYSFLPANGLMFIKCNVFLTNGTSVPQIIITSILGWLLSVVIVCVYVKHMDILSKEKI